MIEINLTSFSKKLFRTVELGKMPVEVITKFFSEEYTDHKVIVFSGSCDVMLWHYIAKACKRLKKVIYIKTEDGLYIDL